MYVVTSRDRRLPLDHESLNWLTLDPKHNMKYTFFLRDLGKRVDNFLFSRNYPAEAGAR